MHSQLVQTYFNPFSSTTQFHFYLPTATKVSFEIFNRLGQQVYRIYNLNKPAGENVLDFDGSNLSDGLYFYQMRTLQFQQVNKMLISKYHWFYVCVKKGDRALLAGFGSLAFNPNKTKPSNRYRFKDIIQKSGEI
jgi:hypothetical protein